MAADSVGIIAEGATLTLDAGATGVLVGFTLPGNEFKEYRVDGLGAIRELFKRSTKRVGQILTFTLRYDTKQTNIADDARGEFILTLPIQDNVAPSTQNQSWTFDGYVLTAGELEGEMDSEDGITQEFTVRLDSEIVKVLES